MVKKILFPFVGDTIGGSHFSALTIFRNLDRKKWEPLIVVHKEGLLTTYFKNEKIAYTTLPTLFLVGERKNFFLSVFLMFSLFWKTLFFIKKNNIAIVHTHDMRMHMTWACAARVLGLVHIWHQRTVFPKSRICYFFAKLPTHIIAISHYVKESLPPAMRTKTKILLNPVEPCETVTPEQIHGLRKEICGKNATNEIIISTFGNLREIKQPLFFVEAAAKIQRQYNHPITFAIFGNDNEGYIPRIKALAKERNIEKQIVFMGFKTPVIPWIAASDLVLATSKADGFGRTIFEAMAAGTGVIATNIGGHREIINHEKTGLLVSPDNPQEMADAAIRLLKGPALLREIKNNASQALGRFSLETYMEHLDSIYAKA